MGYCQRLYLFPNGLKLYLGTTAILVTLAPTTSTCSFVVKSGGQICWAILDILKHCEMCKKHSSTPVPSRSVIPCDDGAPYKQWAINAIGPMPSNSQNKRYIITGIDFCTCWPVAQAVARHNWNFIRRFIGQEIIKKFGTPKRNTNRMRQRIYFSGYTGLSLLQGDWAHHHNTLSFSS